MTLQVVRIGVNPLPIASSFTHSSSKMGVGRRNITAVQKPLAVNPFR